MYLILEYSTVAAHILEDMLAHMRVHSWEGIIEKIDVCVIVNGTSEGYALLLAAWQVDALKGEGTVTDSGTKPKRGLLLQFLQVKCF